MIWDLYDFDGVVVGRFRINDNGEVPDVITCVFGTFYYNERWGQFAQTTIKSVELVK